MFLCNSTFDHMIIWSLDHILIWSFDHDEICFENIRTHISPSTSRIPPPLWSVAASSSLQADATGSRPGHSHAPLSRCIKRVLTTRIFVRSPFLLEQAGLWEWLGGAQEHHKPPAQHRLGGRVPGALLLRL